MIADRPPRLSRRWAGALVVGLALLHAALAVAYAQVTPYRTPGVLLSMRGAQVPDIGAPDERQHVNYVVHLLEGRGLPVLRPEIPDPADPTRQVRNPNLIEEYEAHQPPLYYLLAAGFAKALGLEPANLHDPQAGRPIRYLNALFGAATVVGVYFLGVWGLSRRDVSLLAAAIAALLPMHAALSGASSNDPLTFALCTWALALMAHGIANGWRWPAAMAAGLVIGLALLTKSTTVLLLPALALAMAVRRDARPRLVIAVVAFALALLLVYPWWARNQSLYGDPLGLGTFKVAFQDAITAGAMIERFGAWDYWTDMVGWWTARSFFGVFGYMDVFLNETGTPLTTYAAELGPFAPNLLYWALIAAAAVAAARAPRAARELAGPSSRPVLAVGLVFLALLTMMFVQYNLTYFQGQGRYFYPAIGPIALGLALGFLRLGSSRPRLVAGIVAGSLLALNVYALARLPGEFERRQMPSLSNETP